MNVSFGIITIIFTSLSPQFSFLDLVAEFFKSDVHRSNVPLQLIFFVSLRNDPVELSAAELTFN
jgi:hypothetical protein